MKQKQKVIYCFVTVTLFGGVCMAAQMLLLRRFLWRFEAAESGVALFWATWLFWSGAGAATAATKWGQRIVQKIAGHLWLMLVVGTLLYFVQYLMLEHLRTWMGIPEYHAFPFLHLALGCLIANFPFCYAGGWFIPAAGRYYLSCWSEHSSIRVSAVFAWEALGSALAGVIVLLLLYAGIAPDPRDVAEWYRYFPKAEKPQRFETGSCTTFYGHHGGNFYALSSGGMVEILPEIEHSMGVAALALSQRPYARSVLLLGEFPLGVALAFSTISPDIEITWVPCDAVYGQRLLVATNLDNQRIIAGGVSPQVFLGSADNCFDLVMVRPPAAVSLEGVIWRETDFIRLLDNVTERGGALLYYLGCDAAALTPESARLIELTAGAVRHVWHQAGMLVPGAGGWWVAAKVEGLVYALSAAQSRLLMLKKESIFPAASLAHIYNPQRAEVLIKHSPILDGSKMAMPFLASGSGDILAAGLAQAIKQEYPNQTPGHWFESLQLAGGTRFVGMLTLILWMLPIVFCGRERARQSLYAALLAAGGALGLTLSLALLYQLQARFGSLYLLAGGGSCLYFTGFFAGNRLSASLKRSGDTRWLSCWIAGSAIVQVIITMVLLMIAAKISTALGVMSLFFPAGMAGGIMLPLIIAITAQGQAQDNLAYLVLADAAGAAVAGLMFVILVPLGGLNGGVMVFVALLTGITLFALLAIRRVRVAGLLIILTSLMLVGRQLVFAFPTGLGYVRNRITSAVKKPKPLSTSVQRLGRRGIPRRVDEALIKEQMEEGRLSTNAALWSESSGQ